jgi:exodeoxyribonuclease VII large subunit
LVALEGFDLRRRMGGVRTRLAAADSALREAIQNRRHGADGRLRDAVGRLDALSPLAVLARGYAVCWTADRATVIRQATDVGVGHKVRVTLGEGELVCDVTAVDTERIERT